MQKSHAMDIQNAAAKPLVVRITSRAAHALLRVGVRHLNPFMLSIAGSRRLPMLAIVHHQGRRSGRVYTTPLAARPTADGFVIPLTFGPQADWIRNVQASGGCTIRWKGADYPVVEPVIVDWPTVRSAFSPLERLIVPLVGIEQCVRLRYNPASGAVLQM